VRALPLPPATLLGWASDPANGTREPSGPTPRVGVRLPAHPWFDGRIARVAYPVEALEMSLLPKFAGQSPSGQGAGKTWCPAVNEA
jgi:hypothetical protein